MDQCPFTLKKSTHGPSAWGRRRMTKFGTTQNEFVNQTTTASWTEHRNMKQTWNFFSLIS